MTPTHPSRPTTSLLPGGPFWRFVVAGFAICAALGVTGLATVAGRDSSAVQAVAYVVLPAAIIVSTLIGQGRRVPWLVAATLLTDAEALIVAPLMHAGLAYAVLFPLVGVGLILESVRGRWLTVTFVLAAATSIIGVCLGLLSGPVAASLRGPVPPISFLASTVFITFGYGLLWRIQVRTAEAIESARAEAAARATAQAASDRLTTAVERAADVVFISDQDRRIIYANPAFERITGYPVGDALGRSIRDLVGSGMHDAAFYAEVHSATTSGRGWSGTIINRRRDGTTFDFEVSMTPIRDESGQVIGAVTVGRDGSDGAAAAQQRERRRLDAEATAALEQVIADVAFTPVFQPIVDLSANEVVGYEALTRFDTGQPPEATFSDAWRLGLGPALELVTLRRALVGAQALPPGRWLDVNVSPALLADHQPLSDVLRDADRPIVLEITEHQEISDYAAVRDLVSRLGPDVRLAVDDAGAGVANFSHIVELRPDLVKLDRRLIRGVNSDLGRQAIVIAMSHFARTAGCRLVAEGIETRAELATLAELGVEFGQGYLLGRPASPLELARRRGRRANPGVHRAARARD